MRHLPAIVLVGFSLVACMNRGQGPNVDSAESAVDSSDSVGSESDLLVATMDGSETTGALPVTGDQIAVRIAANIATRWLNGCATVSATGASRGGRKARSCKISTSTPPAVARNVQTTRIPFVKAFKW